MIKLLTFDLDDTFWDSMPVLVNAEKKAWKLLVDYWPTLAETLMPKNIFQYRNALLDAYPKFHYQPNALRAFSFRKALEHTGCSAKQARKIVSETMKNYNEWRHEVILFPEVLPVLFLLSGKYRLGAVTNSCVDVNRLPIGTYLDFSVRAEDYDSKKPEPALFKKALELAGVQPEETLHVGDCLIADIQGASNLGIGTVWFNPEDRELPDETKPDYIIRSLTGLCRVLNLNETEVC